MAESTPYDEVAYPSGALPQMHPSHLHAAARMFGADAAPPASARVLELGCGDGSHLIACAVAMPEASFVGVDLSGAAVRTGRGVIAGLGLKNVELHQGDFTTWSPPGEGGFDYVSAHGVFSWVPDEAREALLALTARSLAPAGVGYVSYNAFPGGHGRRMLWEMMKFHSAAAATPKEKIGKAVELAELLDGVRSTKKDAAGDLLARELRDVLEERDEAVLYHDDLAECNQPFYVHEFAARAAGHGLRFVAEAEAHTMNYRRFPGEVGELLTSLAGRDVVLKEQYLDFLRVGRFRQTILAKDGRAPQADADQEAVRGLYVTADAVPDPDPADLTQGTAVKYRSGDAGVQIDVAEGKAALAVLRERYPHRMSFDALVAEAARRLNVEEFDGDRVGELAGFLASAWMVGLVSLHGFAPEYAEAASERPVASPLVRRQIRDGEFATTLLHSTLHLSDGPSRHLVGLLDGTRTRADLARDMAAVFPAGKRPPPAALAEALERNLARLALAGVLVS